MKRILPILLVLPLTAFAGTGSNYAECLLDNMPGIANAQAHAAAQQLCLRAHPDGFSAIQRGGGRGLFSRQTPEQCTLSKARDTQWPGSASMIRQACECLYVQPQTPLRMCDGSLAPDPQRDERTRAAARLGADGANQEFKKGLGEGVLAASARVEDKAVILDYTIFVDAQATEYEMNQWRRYVRSQLRSSICPEMQEMASFTSGLSYNYRYTDQNKRRLKEFVISAKTCSDDNDLRTLTEWDMGF